MMRLRGALVGVVVLLAGGCAAQPDVDYSHLGVDDVAFRLKEWPSSPLPPEAAFLLPLMTVYGDGRVVRVVTDSMVALPLLVEQQLTPAGMKRLLNGARDAGLAQALDFGEPECCDRAGTTLTLLGRTTTVVLDGDDAAARAARKHLGSFIARVKSLETWLGPEISAPEPYTYSRAAVIAFELDPGGGDADTSWPLSGLGGGEQAGTGRCIIVGAGDLKVLGKAMAGMSRATLWRSDGSTYWVTIRPLLPGETDCASVTG